MERLERDIEGDFGPKFSAWSTAEGYNTAYVKFTGARGWPDRIVTWGTPDGPAHLVWIEWKRPNEEPRPLQKHIHKVLRAMGHDVRVYDDYRVALEDLKAEVAATFRADARDEAHCLGGRGPTVPPARKG